MLPVTIPLVAKWDNTDGWERPEMLFPAHPFPCLSSWDWQEERHRLLLKSFWRQHCSKKNSDETKQFISLTTSFSSVGKKTQHIPAGPWHWSLRVSIWSLLYSCISSFASTTEMVTFHHFSINKILDISFLAMHSEWRWKMPCCNSLPLTYTCELVNC